MAKIKAELITNMGDDLMVVNSARVSFDKESELEPEALCPTDEHGGKIPPYRRLAEKDKKLISYLAKHGHWTPFSHPQITMRETVPIFVARQRFKHVVGFTYNEVSRRYVDDEPEFYTPDSWRSRPDGSVKQGSGGDFKGYFWTEEDSGIDRTLADVYECHLDYALELYKEMIEKKIAPEQARMVLPQSMMTSYYTTGSLAAFARMVKQRKDPHSQKEIQDLAHMVDSVIRPLYPVSWSALVDDLH